MKYATSLLLLFTSLFCLAQVPLVEIEGNTSIFLGDDTTSVHIGKNVGLNRDPDTPLENTLIGTNAGRKLSYGLGNSFLGFNTGASNSSGSRNSFLGSFAGYNNTAGLRNSMFGFEAGYKNDLGNYNSFFGSGAGYNNTSGSENNFFGRSAGVNNSTGFENNFFGTNTGYTNSIGKYNSFFGDEAGYSNSSGEFNVFIGYETGYFNQIGDKNSFLGSYAGSNSTGDNNVGIGYASGVSGSNNVTIGYKAGDGISQGDNNIIIGYEAGPENQSSMNNRLFIDVNRSLDPLIYGEFDNDLIRINGDFHPTGKVLLENNQNVIFKEADGITEQKVLSLDDNDHTILNAENDIIFNSGGTIAGAFRAMTIKADNKVGIGTQNPLWRTVVKEGANAITGGATIDISNLAMVFAKEANVNSEGVGIGFQSSSDEENVGAAIVHERTGASSKGKLHFASKTTTGVGDDIQVTMTISDDGKVGIGNINPITTLDVGGDINGAGLFCNYISACSDVRLKREFSSINNGLEKIMRLNGYYHFWNTKDYPEKNFTPKQQIGFKAQEVSAVLPEVVNTTPEGYLSVEYGKIVPLLVEAIKEQQAIINNLKSQLESRDQQFASLLSRIEQLENNKTGDDE